MNIKTQTKALIQIPMQQARYHEREARHYLALAKVTKDNGLAEKYMHKSIDHDLLSIEYNLDMELGQRFYLQLNTVLCN